MKKNKYYKPTINELVPGLTVEYDYPEKPFRLNYTIRKFSILYADEHSKTIIYDIANGNPLVKYLDEEDIISLGFKKQMCGNYTYGNGNLIWLFALENKIKIMKYSNDDFANLFYSDSIILFYGYIKNKLELKKILQQIDTVCYERN